MQILPRGDTGLSLDAASEANWAGSPPPGSHPSDLVES